MADGPAPLLRGELHAREGRLSCRLSLARRFDSMAHGVADHVHEWLGQAFQNASVQLGVVPADQELDVLPFGRRDVADRSGKRRCDRRERHHAHLDRGVLQLAEQPATQIELVGHRLVAAAAIVADHVLEPAPVQHGLGDEVEQTIDLLRRHADRTSIGGRRCGRRFGDDRRVGGGASKGARHACGEVLEQARSGLVVTGYVPRSASVLRSSGSASCVGNCPAERACERTSSTMCARSRTVSSPSIAAPPLIE